MNHRIISKKAIITLVAIFTFLSLFAATDVADSTIVANYKGGKITMGDINERLSQIPPMYKSKYTTIEGKKELLDMICIEEVFYLEALSHKVIEQKEFTQRIDDQIKSAYFSEYRKELLKDGVSITIEEKKAYFAENHDRFKDRTFSEAEKMIETKLKPEKENALIEAKKQELFTKLDVEINYDLLVKINISALDSNEVIINEKVISSSNSKINRTVGDIIAHINILPKRAQMSLHSEAGLKRHVDELAKSDVFYIEALANGLDKNPVIISTVNQIKRNMALRTIYNTLVVEAIDTSNEAVTKYYNDNIDQFSTLAYRKIQTFGFDTKKSATKMRKTVKKLIKKQKDEEINTLIAENSIYTSNNGILDHIYNNGIIPGMGKDEVYCDMVWATDPGKLSDVFQNSKEKYVFFRIIEDIIATATPFEEVKDKVKNNLMKTLSKEKFESVKEGLETKYALTKYPDKMVVKLSAEEYFNKAEAAQKRRRFNDAIFYYDEVMKYHKNNKDDYKAMFMKGFLFAEELKDTEKAIEIFEKFLTLYPEGDLSESAQYMLSSLKNKEDMIDSIEFEDK
ncbi:MAG: peptidyl-prolyl cis-trans isomerase [Candidatus Cloacimonetes bacterium]|nr:peptidyl-prolyl cis-trans isomerase [Candidatus Cloacimonadota bacterium]